MNHWPVSEDPRPNAMQCQKEKKEKDSMAFL